MFAEKLKNYYDQDGQMKNICYINGSLRGKEASSLSFIKDLDGRMKSDFNKEFITVKAGVNPAYGKETFIKIAEADVLIFTFPLFAYSLPGALMRLLEEYWNFIKSGHSYNKDAAVYAVINCGFPVPAINREAVRVVKNFCSRLNLKWRFAVCISSGPVVVATKKIPFLDLKLKRAFNRIVQDISTGNVKDMDDFFIKPVIPKPIILMIKKRFENKIKKGVKTIHEG
jgi:hypothetical protein